MRLRRSGGRESGSALVELAVALPLLVVIIAGTVDFARVFYAAIELTNAARAGAQYGARAKAFSDQFTQMQAIAINSAPNLGGVSAAGSRLCQCSTNAGVFSATSPANTCSAAACTGSHLVVTVTVTTSATFSTIMGIVPGIPNSIQLNRAATMRVPNIDE